MALIVYQTDINDIYVGTVIADVNPVRPDDYIIPGGAYLDAPPPLSANQVAKRSSDKTTWVVLANFVGVSYWTSDGIEHVISNYGDTVPDGASLTVVTVPLTEEQKKINFTLLVQKYIDAPAKAWGYDDAKSAVGYVDDPFPQYNADGIAIRNFRSQCWQVATSMYASVIAGTIPEPTPDQVLAALPVAPTKPTVG